MDVLRIIAEGISNDQLSLYVFYVLGGMFLLDLFLYIVVWFNISSLNRKLEKGYIYKNPLRQLVEGFEDLIKISTHDINTRAYVEDYFSRYKGTVLPLPIFDKLQIPLISVIKFIKETVSLFILVGVLGTFVGIYTSLVHLLGSDGVLAGLDSITPVLSGMGTAFATSIVGMSFALFTTFLLKLFNAEQYLVGIMARTENYLDNELKIGQKSFMAKSFKGIEEGITRGFNRLYNINEKTYNAFKGFEEFSSQFKEAASHMDTFNKNLAASMADLNEFYQTNKKFTKNFACEINGLTDQLKQLFTGIDTMNKQEKELITFLENSYQMQAESSSIIENINQQFSNSQEDLKNSFLMFREQLESDKQEINRTLEILKNTSNKQNELSSGLQYLYKEIGEVRREVAVTFEDNVHELNQTMKGIKNSYSSEMNRNVKTFAEHVNLSNKIMTSGLDSIKNKFDDNELLMAKYLGGIAFNANDLETVIKDLNNSVKKMDENIKDYNQLIKGFKKSLEKSQVLKKNVGAE